MIQSVRKIGRGKGWIEFRCEGRRYRVERCNGWEVAIWDNHQKAFTLSTGETPEGVFKRRRDAIQALYRFIIDHPVPEQTDASARWLS